MRVLISAYACEPHKGSEQGSGWGWVKQIAKFAEVRVITRANNRKTIEEELNKNPISDLHFEYVDLPKWLRFWKKGERNLYLYYVIWQIMAYIRARKLNRTVRFHIVHQLTFGSFWLPTFLAFLPTKFIWGPIGGAEVVPKAFIRTYRIGHRITEFLRIVLMKSFPRLNPIFRYSSNKAMVIITKTANTAEIFYDRYKDKTKVIVSGGMPFDNSTCPHITVHNYRTKKLRILSAGRLLYWRNFDLAIKAFSKFKSSYEGDAELIIVGGGPEEKNLKSIAINDLFAMHIQVTGLKTREEVLRYMAESDIFLFPSIKDAGAWVVFEAMFFRLPIICLDIAGFSEIVNNSCGIKIRPETPEQAVEDLSKALLKLALSPQLRKEMGEAGSRRIRKLYNWDRKGKTMKHVYDLVLRGT